MNDSFERLKGRRQRLPDPPQDVSDNFRAPEMAPPSEPTSGAPTRLETDIGSQPSRVLRPRVDGRARLRKDRTEALSTKIKPYHRDLLMSLADAYDATLSETLESAIEALAARAKQEGKKV